MLCKKCNQELPEIGDFCPFCGAPKEELVEEELLQMDEEVIATEEETAEQAEETAEEAGQIPEEAKPKLKLWQIITIIAGGIFFILLTDDTGFIPLGGFADDFIVGVGVFHTGNFHAVCIPDECGLNAVFIILKLGAEGNFSYVFLGNRGLEVFYFGSGLACGQGKKEQKGSDERQKPFHNDTSLGYICIYMISNQN